MAAWSLGHQTGDPRAAGALQRLAEALGRTLAKSVRRGGGAISIEDRDALLKIFLYFLWLMFHSNSTRYGFSSVETF